jgi:site-specific DNA recombinase
MIAVLKPHESLLDRAIAIMRVALYPRVSTPDQEEEGTSLESQEQRMRTYCAARPGYRVDERHIYRETHTGKEFWERQELNRLRAAVRAGEVDVVLCYAIDRLTRNQAHLYIFADECERAGVRLEFVTESFEDSAVGRFLRSAKAFAAEVEHEKIKERTLRGKRTRGEKGKIHNHGAELYGYQRDKARGVRVIEESEARIIRRIFQWYVGEKVGIRTIVTRLNDDPAWAVPAPTAGKRTYKNGRIPRWRSATIRRLLADPSYKGEGYAWRTRRVAGGKKWPELRPVDEWIPLPEGTVPQIVSPATWEAAQVRLETNRGQDGRNKARPYLLRGVIRCGHDDCGAPMRASPERGTRTYRCSSRERPDGPCGGSRVSADQCEAWAWAQIAAVLRDPSIIAAEYERQRAEGPDTTLLADKASAERALARLDKQQERLLRRFRQSEDGDDEADDTAWQLVKRELAQVEAEKKQFRATITEAEQRLADAGQALAKLEALTAFCANWQENVERATWDDQRLAIEALGVVVSANGHEYLIRGNVPLDGAGPSGAIAGTVSITCSCKRHATCIPFSFSNAGAVGR